MSYCIYVVSPQGYRHSATFHEIAQGLREGFAELGIVAPIVKRAIDVQGRAVVLGGNLLPTELAGNDIIFNLEQADSGWMTTRYLELLRQHEVWDYSANNIALLREQGIDAKHCQIGYAACLTRIAPAEEDIDVLFYGSMTPRREAIWKTITDTGLNCKHLFDVYGDERDHWIGRSKIILNMHAYDTSPFEIVRVSYLLANKRFVLSEAPMYIYEVPSAHAPQLPAECKFWVNNPTARAELAARAFHSFQSTRQSEYLRPLVTP